MEYQKIINLLDNTTNQLAKFRTKNWFGINDDSCGTYITSSQIKFKTSMSRSSLCDYSDVYILVKGNIIVTNTAATPNNTNKKVTFENCAPFTVCISETNNTGIDHAKDIDIVIPMYNLTVYSDNYSKTSGSLWQYYRDKPFIDNNPDTTSFNYKQEITDQTGNNGKKDVQIMVPLKYLSIFWRPFEIPLINCEINIFFQLGLKNVL